MLFDKIKIYSEDILKMWCFISKYAEIVMIEDFLYKRKGQCNMVQSLARGIEILSIIQEKGSTTAVEIATELDVDKSTVSRLISTLMQYDMISIDPISKKYRLGFRLLYLSEGVKRNFNIAMLARPYLYKICDETKESVHLAVMGNKKMYIADQVRSQREYNLSAQIGMIEAWHFSSVGKCVLAYKPQSFIENLFSDYDFEKYTTHTIDNFQDLEMELKKIKEQGYAIDDEERTLGVRCMAVPIFNYGGNVSYCIGISAPKEQITEKTKKQYISCMKKYARQISNELGYGLYHKV